MFKVLRFLLIVVGLTGATAVAASAPSTSSPSAGKSQVELFQASSPDDTQIQKMPLNLSRVYLGTKISSPQIDAANQRTLLGVLADDMSFRYRLPAGRSTFIVALSQSVALNRFSFLITGTEGTVEIKGATMELTAASNWWQPLVTKSPFVASTEASFDWPWADVRYVKVEFDLKGPGMLSPIGIYGTPTISDLKVISSKPGSAVARTAADKTGQGVMEAPSVTDQINVASPAAHGRVSYVSSGLERPQSASVIIDNDLASAYTFDDDDPNPTFVVELDNSHPICRISTYYQAASPGVWEIYPLNGLPTDESTPSTPAPGTPPPKKAVTAMAASTPFGLPVVLTTLQWAQGGLKALKMPPGFFEQNKPSFTISNKEGDPFGVVEFKPQPCRFVLMRWVPSQPSGGSPGVKVYQVSIFTDPKDEWLHALPRVSFASLGPDLTGAHGLGGGEPGVNPPSIPGDPPRQPLPPTPTPPVVSP